MVLKTEMYIETVRPMKNASTTSIVV